MSDTLQFASNLSKWQDQDPKNVSDILKRLEGSKLDKEKPEHFHVINKAVFDFHKQIQNSQSDLIDNSWFSSVLKIKKKLKKISDTLAKKVQQKPQLIKKPSIQLKYPQDLFVNVRPSEADALKILFKNFVNNFPQAMEDPRTVQFLKKVNLELRQQFSDEIDEKKHKRIDSICMHLAKELATGAKMQMLQGLKSPKEVAKDEENAYKDIKTLKRIEQLQQEQFLASQTGFYDNMKKDIFKGASEECRYCHKMAAYCDDMKQIRASDQPMTRFMKCNNCNKNWRD